MKLAAITPIPTPYRAPYWSCLARRPEIDLHVYYCSPGKSDRPWRMNWPMDFEHSMLPGVNLLSWRGKESSCFWNPSILQALRSGGYDGVLCGGYNHVTMLAAILYARIAGIPYFLMCETYFRPRQAAKMAAKRLLVGSVVRNAAGTFPTGQKACEYLERYGATRESMQLIPNAPDVSALGIEVQSLLDRRDELRREFGFGTRPVVLFAGRLIKKKGLDRLLRAAAEAGLAERIDVLVAGDGPERGDLEALAAGLGLGGSVHFAGFAQPNEMSRFYAAADLFVLPSSETWGVVVLEALAAGLPVIVTEEVGCHPDVVTSPTVGKVVPARSISALAEALRKMLDALPSRDQVAEAWAPVFQSMRYENIAERMILGLRRGLKHDEKEKPIQNAGNITGEGNDPMIVPPE